MNVAPGATFEAYSPEFGTGLVGTIGARIRDGAGADFLARTTAGITEDVTVGANASYLRSFTAPTTSGQYWLIWDDGTTVAEPQEIVVTYSAASISTASLYITRDEMKYALSNSGQSYADDDIDRACSAVSRAIDEAARPGSHFFQATETRYYTPDWNGYWGYQPFPWREQRLEIDDITTLTSLTVDTGADGTYATTWVEGTDFFLDPANAAVQGLPFEEVLVRSVSGRWFPAVQRAIKIVGTFGWPEVPPQVAQYAQIFAAQLVLRSRQAPFGILMAGIEVGATARLMRLDPDFERLLGSFARPKLFI